MRNLAIGTSICRCDEGSATNLLVATTLPTLVIEGQAVATISDILFSGPFGTCDITRRTCSFSPAGSWSTVVGTVLFGGQRPLVKGAHLPCSVGGTVEVLDVVQASLEVGQLELSVVCGRDDASERGAKLKQLLAGHHLGIPTSTLRDAAEGEPQRLAMWFINHYYPDDDYGWVKNAARHGVWMGILSVKYGEDTATKIGEIHEIVGPGTETDHWVDRYNNAVARRIASVARKGHPHDVPGLVKTGMDAGMFITDPEDRRVPSGLRCRKKR